MLFSVIIPVYNAELSLNRVINSVLTQSYQDFELILVNDGSTDNSLNICNQYQKQDQRIILINQPNRGVSSARNKALSISKGKWIVFIDSDDELLPNALDTYQKAVSENIDIIRAAYEVEENGDRLLVTTSDWSSSNKEKILLNCINSKYSTYIWNTCFRKDVIKCIKFHEEIVWCEDHLFTLSAIKEARNIAFISTPTYRYTSPASKSSSYNHLSNRHIDPSLIIKEAILEKDLCESMLTQNENELKAKIKNDYNWKTHFALKQAILNSEYLQALSIVWTYHNQNILLLIKYILHLQVIPFAKKIFS